MSQTNHSLSRIFKDMVPIYQYMESEERFRALAYNKASRVIDGLKDDIIVFNE